MPKVAVYNTLGQVVGEMDLAGSVFDAPVNRSLLHRAVVRYLANQRQGTHATKNRAAVSGGGRKPWRQKGTGRARQGSIRAPQWRHGGVVFGPMPRDYRQDLPRKARRAAMRAALTAKLQSGDLLVLDRLSFDQPKTRQVVDLLRNLRIDRKALLVTRAAEPNVVKSARNIPGVGVSQTGSLNVYQVLLHDKLVLTQDAVAALQEVLA